MSEITIKLSEEDRKALAQDVAALIEQRDTTSPWMTVREAAEYARIPVGTLREWTQQGRVRRYGRKQALFRRDHLDEDLTRWRS